MTKYRTVSQVASFSWGFWSGLYIHPLWKTIVATLVGVLLLTLAISMFEEYSVKFSFSKEKK